LKPTKNQEKSIERDNYNPEMKRRKQAIFRPILLLLFLSSCCLLIYIYIYKNLISLSIIIFRQSFNAMYVDSKYTSTLRILLHIRSPYSYISFFSFLTYLETKKRSVFTYSYFFLLSKPPNSKFLSLYYVKIK